MNKLAVLGTSLAALLAAGCQDQTTAPAAVPSAPRAAVAAAPGMLGGAPLGYPTATGRLSDFVQGARVINPADYACATTPVNAWLSSQVFGLPAKDLDVLRVLVGNSVLALDVLTYEAAIFQTESASQTFGVRGEFTQVVGKTEKDLKRFWDIPSADIQFVPMHGRTLADAERVAATYEFAFGLPAANAKALATAVGAVLATAPGLKGGDFPYFTFNAVATKFPAEFGIPDKVLVGDGVLTGYAVAGFADVAPQAILAHEFGHHVQYRRDYFDDALATTGSAAEQTRYTELMADAFSAYFLTHARGASMNQKRVEQFLQVFYNIGDCSFGSDGHHGTPNQRMAAARFGFALADEAQKQGHILSSEAFHALFVAAYPTLIAPDAR